MISYTTKYVNRKNWLYVAEEDLNPFIVIIIIISSNWEWWTLFSSYLNEFYSI